MDLGFKEYESVQRRISPSFRPLKLQSTFVSILKSPKTFSENPTTNDLRHRPSSKKRTVDLGLVGLQGMFSMSASDNFRTWQMRLLIISCSLSARVDGLRLINRWGCRILSK